MELQELYSFKDKVCPTDRHIFYNNMETHLDQHASLDLLEDWININKQAIRASMEQAQKLGVQRNRRIDDYLTNNPSSQGNG